MLKYFLLFLAIYSHAPTVIGVSIEINHLNARLSEWVISNGHLFNVPMEEVGVGLLRTVNTNVTKENIKMLQLSEKELKDLTRSPVQLDLQKSARQILEIRNYVAKYLIPGVTLDGILMRKCKNRTARLDFYVTKGFPPRSVLYVPNPNSMYNMVLTKTQNGETLVGINTFNATNEEITFYYGQRDVIEMQGLCALLCELSPEALKLLIKSNGLTKLDTLSVTSALNVEEQRCLAVYQYLAEHLPYIAGIKHNQTEVGILTFDVVWEVPASVIPIA